MPDPRTVTRIDTNRDKVKATRRRGWDVVAFGKEIDHAEYLKFTAALAAAVAADNPALVELYLKHLLQEMRRELVRNLKREGRRVLPQLTERLLMQALHNALHGRSEVLRIEGIDIEIGIATYNHWKKISGHYPKIDKGRVTWDYLEKKMPLPNTHQPFVRFRVRART